jgi:serine/threonine protein kinase
LRDRLRDGPLSSRKAIDYARQIASGLAAAHEKGIVHRDLKPENLFITNDGRAKILDFGLAKLTRPEADASGDAPTQQIATDAGTVMGTVGYMAPEQVRGKAADARADIFAFGAILYEMLSGKRAFHGAYLMDVNASSAPRPLTPEGTTGSLVTPDGKFLLAVDANHQRWLYPIAGGNPQKLNLTLSPEESVFSFFADGKSVLVRGRGLPVKVFRVDLATGVRQPFKEIVPADPAGAQSVPSLRFSADGKSYVYSLGRWLSDLYVVDGLK